jgi:sulfatase maturation enzyme AslB (radical SAM superfamily)
MRSHEFHISWEDGRLIYVPEDGVVITESSRTSVRIPKRRGGFAAAGPEIAPDRLRDAFRPVCLTVFAGRSCNLECRYCYGAGGSRSSPDGVVSMPAVAAAAETVAANCVTRKMPFVLGFHGGNEPLLRPELLSNCIRACEKICGKYALPLHAYCTTNGAVPEATARWAADTFHGITLSWDGAPAVHDESRRFRDGGGTGAAVIRTWGIFHSDASRLKRVKIRTTVTRRSVEQLPSTVQYLSAQGVRSIDVYPVYQNIDGSVDPEMMPGAERFVKNFLVARRWAEKRDVHLEFSGNRLSDFHGRHCCIFQDNLTLTSDGAFTACFQADDGGNPLHSAFHFGRFDASLARAEIDWEKLHRLWNALSRPSRECGTCVQALHCSMMCPGLCPAIKDLSRPEKADCRMENWIGLANLLEAAGFRIPDVCLEDSEQFFTRIRITRKTTDADAAEPQQIETSSGKIPGACGRTPGDREHVDKTNKNQTQNDRFWPTF